MGTQMIAYRYDGDENAWEQAIQTFLNRIADDPLLRDNFSYDVFVDDDGIGRIHIPHWANDATLDHLKAQAFFSEFAKKVQGFGGDSLKVTKPKIGT